MNDESNSQTLIETALEIWTRRKWLVLVCFMAVFGTVAGVVMALPDLYRSSTTLIVGQDDVTESLVENNVSSELELRLGIIQQALMSRGQLQEVIEEFNLYEEMRRTAPPASVIERLRKDIEYEQEPYAQPQWGQSATYAVTITYRAWNPDLAAAVANDLARRFQAENDVRRSSQANRATNLIREQLEGARQEFLAQEERVTEFRNANMGYLPEQQDLNLSNLSRLNQELLQNGQRQIQLANRQEEAYARARAGSPDAAGSLVSDRARLEGLRQELETLKGMYTDSHPEVIRLEREIQALSLELSNSATTSGTDPGSSRGSSNPQQMDREMNSLRAEERRLQSEILELTQRIEDSPRIEQELKRLAYDYDAAREEYLALEGRFRDAELAESLELEQNQEVKVVEVAIRPDFPAAPNRMRLLFVGLILAGGFAAGVLLLVEQLNKTFHSTRDLRQFTRVPVLASIGTIQTARDRWIGRARFGLYAVLVVGGLFILTGASYQYGQDRKGLVMAIAG